MIAVKLIGVFIEAIGDEYKAQQSILEWSNHLTYSQLYKSHVKLASYLSKGILPLGMYNVFVIHVLYIVIP